MDDGRRAAADEGLRNFLLRACHDLRTPLRAVRANAELLRLPGRREGPDIDQILGFIVEGAQRMDSLVDGLAGYTLALHTEERSFLPIKLGVVLRSAIAKLAAEIRGCDGEVSYGELPRVAGDPDRLQQLFENLLRNALQCRGSAPPRIHVSAATQDGAWLVAMRDNGIGIEAGDTERIFRPFERLRRNGTAGAGLGLASCQEIVTRHGGKIWAGCEGGREGGSNGEPVGEPGATIFFTLPAGAD